MVLGRRQLVVARLVGDPRHREAPDVPYRRAQVDGVGGVGQILALHDEGPHALAQVRLAHGLGVATAPRRVACLHDRQPAATVLDEATSEPRQPCAEGRLPRALVLHHGVVVHVGDRPPLVRVQEQVREVPDDDRLEVAHQVATEGRVLEPREEQDARRLDRAAGHDDELGVHGAGHAVGTDELDARRRAPLCHDTAHVGLSHELDPTCGHGPGEQGHRVALGVDRAAEERAEPAVVARGPPVVGDAVGRRRRLVGMEPDLLGGGRGQHGPVHGGPGCHGVGARPPGGKGVRTLPACHADGPLHLGVERLELVVVDGPVVDGRTLLRTVGGEEAEVLFPEARHLAVGVGSAAPDSRRDGVHLAHVRVLALVGGPAEGPRLDQRVGSEEVARDELDLVVRVVTCRPGHVVGVEQVVPPLLHDHHRPARPRQHLGRGGPAGPGPDDDGVGCHGWDTSASLYPRGCTSPS